MHVFEEVLQPRHIIPSKGDEDSRRSELYGQREENKAVQAVRTHSPSPPWAEVQS